MSIVSVVKRFLLENFWYPATGRAGDYNIFNTTVYAGLFAVAAAYLGFPFLKKLDIDIDRRFFIGIAPYVLLGGAVRGLEDMQLVETFLLVTPFIYFTMFFFTASVLVVAKKAEERSGIEYHKPFAAVGSLALVSFLSLYELNNLAGFVSVVSVYSAVLGLGYFVLKYGLPQLSLYGFGIPVAAHFWDATTSAVAISYGASEKHVLASYFVETMGPAGMFVMKGLVIIPVVYYIVQNMEGEEKKYYLFLIALLGFALGTRNFLSMLALT
ncbi:MAG: DUF63 family protein [Candidatus Nanohaloarchaea archaeon]